MNRGNLPPKSWQARKKQPPPPHHKSTGGEWIMETFPRNSGKWGKSSHHHHTTTTTRLHISNSSSSPPLFLPPPPVPSANWFFFYPFERSGKTTRVNGSDKLKNKMKKCLLSVSLSLTDDRVWWSVHGQVCTEHACVYMGICVCVLAGPSEQPHMYTENLSTFNFSFCSLCVCIIMCLCVCVFVWPEILLCEFFMATKIHFAFT